MKILTRYIFREFLVPYAYCLIGFLSIYVLFELFGSFGRLAEADMSAGDVVRFFAGYLAPYFHYLVPAALMLATLYTMWNFCRHSELVAMRARNQFLDNCQTRSCDGFSDGLFRGVGKRVLRAESCAMGEAT